MKNLTDLQLCSCVILKYALVNGQNDLIAALIVTLLIELEMDYDLVLRVMRDINLLPCLNCRSTHPRSKANRYGMQASDRSKAGLAENKTSFEFTGELDKTVRKILMKKGKSVN